MKKSFLIGLMLALPLITCAQQVNIIPYPSEVDMLQGHLLINKNTRFYTVKNRFANMLSYFNGEFGDKKKGKPGKKQLISIAINPGDRKPGSYTLNITPKTIAISAVDSTGIFNGMITLLQLSKSAKSSEANLILP